MRRLGTIDPSWMIPPVSTLLSSLVLVIVKDDYYEYALFCFAFGLITWLPIFVITVHRFIVTIPPGGPVLVTLWTWIAPPAIAFVAYINLKPEICATCDPWEDITTFVLLWSAVVLYLILLTLTVLHYFGNDKFSAAWWGYVFPLATLAMALLVYHHRTQTDASEAFAVLAMIQITWITAHWGTLTVGSILRKGIFNPPEEFAPLGITSIVHYAFRGALKKLTILGKRVQSGNADNETQKDFAKNFLKLAMAHEEHAAYEDEDLFPLLEEYFPGVNAHAGDEHKRDHRMFQNYSKIAKAILADDSSADISSVASEIPNIAAAMEEHMDFEEIHLSPIVRKYVPIKLQKRMVKRMWERTSREKWDVILPWLINSNEILPRRVKLLKGLISAMPYRAQLFGLILHGNVSRTMWERLTRYAPEIRPKDTLLHLQQH
eukprot:TRINITY_DN676_c0_g2_i1.p1 TRINITY_DN676_c0_g2~~TRINITY_DN676_c0_g2_i1.p1  ORF type:complete len:433 (+),score=52.77 TRINITY_DN676_c0_g2_i1:187-1485(+)